METCEPVNSAAEPLELPEGTVVLQGDQWVQARLTIDSTAGTIASVELLSAPLDDVSSASYFLIPGLIDTHVHVAAPTADLAGLTRFPRSYVAVSAVAELRRSLRRGFTTLRDAGGADCGVARAAAEGLVGVCPRLLFTGRALSQTGGHGDFRGPGEHGCPCADAHAAAGIGRVCDGVAECRKACRDELRQGAHAIKIMAGGGVASPTDRLEDLQFSEEEISAMVDEAARKHTYVMAHAYTPASIERCVRLGVRSIEHGNQAHRARARTRFRLGLSCCSHFGPRASGQLDEASAAAMARCGAFLSQTNVTYAALRDSGAAAGMPAALVAKVGALVEQGRAAVALARRAGVRVTYGSDLLGSMRHRQLEGFAALLDAGLSPAESLACATATAAELTGLAAGTLEAGRLADLCLLRCNPLDAARLRTLSEDDVVGVWVGGQKGV
eukprot:Transcript_25970.p1 GENE.Transcript_25970~~Transcript_25970.p1  ORF type:complete len:442 (+),score=119.61 Transcript_25970:525-1850(+)